MRSSDSKPGLEIERLVWRWEHGQVTAEELDYRLREETRHVSDEYASRQRERPVLREWGSALINDFEQARSQAYKLCNSRDYGAALRRLRSAEKSLSTMTELLQSHADLLAVKAGVAELLELVPTKSLRRLPTISSVSGLVALAEAFLRDSQYRQAGFVARFCESQFRPLLKRESVTSEQERQLNQRLGRVEGVLASTNHFISSPAEDSIDGLEHLLEILAKGWLRLVARLIADCEILVAPRRRFLESYQGNVAEGTLRLPDQIFAEIESLASQQRWNAATARLRNARVTQCAEDLSSLHDRLLTLATKTETAGAVTNAGKGGRSWKI